MLGLALLAALLAVYWPALHGTPIWDDDAHLTKPELRSWTGLWRIWFDLKATQQYYPLTHSAFWVMHRLWGDWFAGYHLVNVLLHWICALLLVRLLRRLEIPGAWLAAALWALHPIQVESVAWMSELKNTLSGVFYFGAALAYLDFDRERSAKKWAAAFLLFLLGLLSKSVIATLPGALLLVLYWKKKGALSWQRDACPLVPFFLIGMGAGFFTSWVERVYIGANGAIFHLTLLDRCLIAGRAFWFYLGTLIWPANLMFMYPRWEISGQVWWQYLFPVAALGLAGVLALGRRRWSGGPLVATLYFAGTLVPALGFINIYPFRFSFVADHFQYLAGAGPLALAAAGVTKLAESWGAQARLLAQAFSVAALALLGLLTIEQCPIYANARRLWSTTLAENPGCWMAHNNLGYILSRQGHPNEAIGEYEETLRIEPDYDEARVNLGNALFAVGEATEAVAQYREALAIDPHFAPAAYNYGNLLLAENRLDEAIAEYRDALRMRPDYPDAHNNLGYALLQKGRTEEALAELREALRLNPADADTEYNLGNALLREGDTGEAIIHLGKAVELEPGDPGFENALAWILATAPQASLRDGAEALKLALQATRASGGTDPATLRTLAAAYAQAGQFESAVQSALGALKVAQGESNTALANDLGREIKLYQAGEAYK